MICVSQCRDAFMTYWFDSSVVDVPPLMNALLFSSQSCPRWQPSLELSAAEFQNAVSLFVQACVWATVVVPRTVLVSVQVQFLPSWEHSKRRFGCRSIRLLKRSPWVWIFIGHSASAELRSSCLPWVQEFDGFVLTSLFQGKISSTLAWHVSEVRLILH